MEDRDDSMRGEILPDPVEQRPYSRREFLKIAGLAGGAVAVGAGFGGLLAACGEEETTTTTVAQTATTAGGTATTAAATTVVTGAAPNKLLKVGCVMPFTGGYGFYGIAMQPGTDVYVELLNQDGGVKIGEDTYDIEVVYADDGADPKMAPLAAQEVIDKGAIANVGTFDTAAPLAAVFQPQKIMMVSQMQAGINLKENPYFIGGTSEWGYVLYHWYTAAEAWAAAGAPIKKIALCTLDWQEAEFGYAAEQAQTRPESWFYQNNVEWVDAVYTAPGDVDFTGAVTKLYQQGVDTIISCYGPGDQALLMKTIADLGYGLRCIDDGSPTDLDEFIAIAGKENVQGNIAFAWNNPMEVRDGKVAPELLDMAKRITTLQEERTGLPLNRQYTGPFQWSSNMLHMLLTFYQRAGTTDPDKTMEAVIGAEFDDFMGSWTMGGVKAYGDTARIKPDNTMMGVIVDNHIEYLGDKKMPTEW